MGSYGTATGRARTPGIRHQYLYDKLWLNRRGVVLPLVGVTPSPGELDMYRLTQVSGFEDGDVRDARELLSGVDGETSLASLAGGRTIVMEGFMDTGSIPRLEDMKQAFREAFFSRVDMPMQAHDPRQDVFDSYSTNTITDYTLDAGAGTLSVSGGQLVPSTTAAKRARYTGRATGYKSGVVTRKIITGTSITGGAWRVGLRMDPGASDTGLFATLSDTDPGLRVQKVVVGTATDLATVAFNPSISTSYWLRLIVNGDDLTAELWSQAPGPGVPISARLATTATYTMTAAEQATFADLGHAGWSDTPAHVSERYDDFSVEDWTSDVIVNCRKSASLQGVDQQTDGRYRRPFQITLRAPTVDLLSTYVKSALKIMSATAPVAALEDFSQQNWNPFNTTDGRFTDDSAHWSDDGDLLSHGIVQNGLLVARQDVAAVVQYQDGFSQSAGALTGKTPDVGTGNWAGAGDAADHDVNSGVAVRAIASDADEHTGRYAIAGTANFINSRVKISMPTGQSTYGGTTSTWGHGVFARYTDINNWLMFKIEYSLALIGAGLVRVKVLRRVAGTVTLMGSTDISSGFTNQNKDIVLEVDEQGNWKGWLVDLGVTPGTPNLQGQSSVLATGGALATGKVGFYTVCVGADVRSFSYDNFLAMEIQKLYLRGYARFFDRLLSAFPTIGDGTHKAILNFDIPTPSQTTSTPAFYLLLKSLRATNRYIALKVRALKSGSDKKIRISLVKLESGVETAIIAEIDAWSSPEASNVPAPPILVQADFSANLVIIRGTPQVVGGVEANAQTTLTSGNATTYGTGVEGELGFRISQPLNANDKPRLVSIDSYSAVEVNPTPQTLNVTPAGNFKSLPTITLNGPFLAGSYLVDRDPTGEVIRGQLVLAKDLLAGESISYDTRTGKAFDGDGVPAFGRLTLDFDDVVLDPELNDLELIGSSWVVGTSSVELRYRDVWR